ncbi:hypothetical protein HAX54_044207 [Datura stramonium]|uniref:Glycerol-3-phosphate acyltransferase RAM2/GPAT1-8 HAD-like domain-containing protein n=1 Tax=Datura stramonium TaxID=4076 RepID=A0ABS8W4G9_DATST|nr:hypothetical protein [Datura stramonium]
MDSSSIVSELEGVVLKDQDPFSYFMLVAFEASGLIRFAILLILWPLIKFLEFCGQRDKGLKLMIFVATIGVKISEIEAVARAVLPKFYFDDIDMDSWRIFSSFDKRIVVTKIPRIMVERFVKEHLRADDVIGSELVVNNSGLATGFIKDDFDDSISRKVSALFGGEIQPSLGLGRPQNGSSFLSLCEEQSHPPFTNIKKDQHHHDHLIKPLPVIFHDGRLVKRPTPSIALLILLWIPFGVILATIRIVIARGWKAMDPIFFFMNPRPVYEVTFLNQLPVEATCSSGKSPHDVANYVQRILAATLGFECTNFTRKDKYRVLAGNDGIVSQNSGANFANTFKKVVATFKLFIH